MIRLLDRLPQLPRVTPQVRRWIGWIGYPAFYLFALVLFSYFTAPYDRLRYALVAGFNSGDAPLRLELDELSWSWRFPGVSGSGGRFVGKGSPEANGADGEKASEIEYPIDDFYVSLSILPLLVGTTSASFGLDAFGGEVDGSVSDSSDEQNVDLHLQDLDVAQLPYLRDLVGLPMEGLLVGAIDLTLPEGQFSKATGSVKLDIEGLAVGDGKAKIRGTIALPRVDAGLFTLDATIEEGRVDIAEFSSRGTDLELVADGKIRLLDKPENSLVEMNLRFKFTDKYKTQNDVTKALFGAPSSKVPGVFDLDPKIKRAKRDDGFYAWRLTGPLSQLNFQPSTGSDAEAAAPSPATKTRKARKRPRLKNFAAGRSRKTAATERARKAAPRPTPPRPPSLGVTPPPAPIPPREPAAAEPELEEEPEEEIVEEAEEGEGVEEEGEEVADEGEAVEGEEATEEEPVEEEAAEE